MLFTGSNKKALQLIFNCPTPGGQGVYMFMICFSSLLSSHLSNVLFVQGMWRMNKKRHGEWANL